MGKPKAAVKFSEINLVKSFKMPYTIFYNSMSSGGEIIKYKIPFKSISSLILLPIIIKMKLQHLVLGHKNWLHLLLV